MKNYYKILNITPTASIEEIKRAFRINAVKYHPDKNFGDNIFVQKFIDVKEAYDILSNIESRSKYDSEYSGFIKTIPDKEKWKTKEEQDLQKDEYTGQFSYNPHKPFYSSEYRSIQETPQVNPIYDFEGELISSSSDFFKLPKKIGILIYGFTDLKKGQPPVEIKPFVRKGFFATLFAKREDNFYYSCSYIGINGFAFFFCSYNRDNITKSFELNFNDIIQLYSSTTDIFQYSNYLYTEYQFLWLKKTELNQEPELFEGRYHKKDRKQYYVSTHLALEEYKLCRLAEKYYTVYLLDKMDSMLQKDGFIDFYGHDNKETASFNKIRIGIGFLTLLKDEAELFTYKFDQIQKMYIKGTDLFIEHVNFEKKLLIFKSGDTHTISLKSIWNRQFFYSAMEILLGYKIH